MSIKILLLEDDQLLAETLVDLLQEYEVTHAANGQIALDLTFEKKFDLYLLDVNVPLINGITVLKELREAQDTTPAIFLTSHTDKETLTKGFTSGADDYITKPFDNDEIILRIHALLKRSKPLKNDCISLLCHDATHKRILYDNKDLELSPKEYELLILLMAHINNTVPKELIFDALWSSNTLGSDGAIRVHINRLKQLLPQMNIVNIRGIGYKLVP
ncbi:response regulator transcription factor [Sulfurimonas sp. SAG-AH-194-I05]|nr:response regulator transcription factor [Sulfurimonas sp. SAG-AH-194-I05]MDF1875439.1 response regulator transcription factor [Sulfurimonas sp. SAG-AH-194-I05]